jgi:hypothetical protein
MHKQNLRRWQTGAALRARAAEGCFLAVLTISALSCGGSGDGMTEPVPVKPPANIVVSVSPASFTLQAGETQRFSAAVSGGNSSAVTWSTSDASVLTIDASGLATARAAGPVRVIAAYAADPSKQGSAQGVVNAPPLVSGFRFQPGMVVLRPGASGTVGVTALDAGGSVVPGASLQYRASNPAIANINGSSISALALGSTFVEVRSAAYADSFAVAVVDEAGFAAFLSGADGAPITRAPRNAVLNVTLQLRRPDGGAGSLGSLQGALSWDANRLRYRTAQPGSSGFTWIVNEDQSTNGELRFSAFHASGVSDHVTLATLSFDVLGNAGPVPFALTVSSAGDAGGKAITDRIKIIPSALIIRP